MPKKRRKDVDDREPRQRVNAMMSVKAYQRMTIHCLMGRKEPGELLSELVETHCRDWTLQVNPHGQAASKDRPDLTDDVSSTVEIAA